MKDLAKYRGCLLGGAVGDALGYPVEFMSETQLAQKYGSSGISEYELVNGVAQISDDTQMTMFTANGLLLGKTRGMMRGIGGVDAGYVRFAYKDWLLTQTESFRANLSYQYTWLVNLPEMWARRALRNTCLLALASEDNETALKNLLTIAKAVVA